MNQVLEAARQYKAKGWSVIPLHPKSKSPALYSWTEYQNRLPTEEELERWFGSSPDRNIAVVTGSVSGVVVLDFDGEEGLSKLQTLGIKSGLISTTGKGKHLFFKHPGSPIKNGVRVLSGMDVRGDGGYCLVSPSVHPTGKRYSWALNTGVLPEFPANLLSPSIPGKTGASQGWVKEALENVAPGNRRDTLLRVIGKLVQSKLDRASIMTLLSPMLEEFNQQGTDKDAFEVAGSIITDILKKEEEKLASGSGELTFKTFSTHENEYNRRKLGGHGLNLGFKKLDGLMGGLFSEELFVVAARTGTGKTNFLCRMAKNLCKQGKKVLFFSTEMAFDRIWDRYKQYDTTPGEYRNDRLIICDDPISRVGQVTSAVAQASPDVFIFDHVNHIGDDYEALSRYMHEFKTVAQRHHIPGIVAAQLNRAADFLDPEGKPLPPRLSMIKGSGTIEQVAAQVLILSEISTSPTQNDLIGQLDKNRYGEKGSVHFVLRKNPYCFDEAEESE